MEWMNYFSILSHIRDQRCSRLTPKHIEDKLRMRINGPTPEKFNSVKYAKTWVKAGKMRSDDPTHLSQSKRQRISNEKGERYKVIFWSWLAADTVPDPKLHKMDFSQVLERGGVICFFEGWGVN